MYIRDPSLVLDLPLYALDGTSIMDRSAYGELCTVNGASWTPKGRTFDGTNDNIILPANWMPATGTIEIWAKYVRDSGFYLFSSDLNEISIYNGTTGAGTLNFYYDGGARITYATAWADNTFVHLVITYARNTTAYLYVNGAEVDNGAIPDTAVTKVASRLGEGTDGSSDFTGTMGEVRIYNRVLTPAEIQHNYEVTRWRYR